MAKDKNQNKTSDKNQSNSSRNNNNKKGKKKKKPKTKKHTPSNPVVNGPVNCRKGETVELENRKLRPKPFSRKRCQASSRDSSHSCWIFRALRAHQWNTSCLLGCPEVSSRILLSKTLRWSMFVRIRLGLKALTLTSSLSVVQWSYRTSTFANGYMWSFFFFLLSKKERKSWYFSFHADNKS